MSLSAWSDVTVWLPPRPGPLRQASIASAIAASSLTSPGRHHRQADRAGERHRLVLDADHVLLDPRDQLLAPGLDVVLVAALEQHQESHAAEAADDLLRMQRSFSSFANSISTSSLAMTPTSRSMVLNLSSLTKRRQRMPPGAGTARRSLQRFEQLAAMQQAGRRIGAHGIVQLLRELAVVLLCSTARPAGRTARLRALRARAPPRPAASCRRARIAFTFSV